MDTQDCFHVIFHNVKEYYSPDCIINCQFSVKVNEVIAKPSDCYVGIFVVAWDSLDNAIIKKSFQSVEMANIAGHGDGIYNMNFDPKDTPFTNFDEEEFYQFCFYNELSKDVFGASCPFQVCRLREESLIHINETSDEVTTPFLTANASEDEVSWWLKESEKPVDEDFEDTVLVHNKTTLMENALSNAAREKEEALMATKQKFESELRQFSTEKKEIIEKSEAEVNHYKELNKSLAERVSSLKQSLIDSQNVVKQMEKFATENTHKNELVVSNLMLEKDALSNALTNKEFENVEHINKIKLEFNEKLVASDIRCDALNKSLMAEKKAIEKMQFDHEEIVLNLRKEIDLLGIKESESVNETSRTLAELQTKLNTEITQKYEYLNEIEKLTQNVERLIGDNRSKDSLINTEREKLAILSLQQQDMTSRLGSENEKIIAEIKNLKSHEKSLVEAHQKELSCLRNRIAELESILKEEKSIFKSEIDQLNNELNDKINCINILEARIRESNESMLEIETLKEAKLKLGDTVDELNAKLGDLQHENLQLSDESKKLSPSKNTESGSMHALHVANAHMQKQLNHLKKEKEMHYCQQKSVEGNSDLVRENEEFKLRMCMGKKAFDKQYLECQRLRNELSKLKKSVSDGSVNIAKDVTKGEEYNALLLEYNNMQSNHTKRVDELVLEVQALKDHKETSEKELDEATESKENVLKLNEELRVKLLQLVNHYEGKINLLTEENGMLKTQRTALMQGASGSNIEIKNSSPDLVPTVASITCEQPNLIQMNRDVVMRTERNNKEMTNSQEPRNEARSPTKVVNRQPDIGNATGVTLPSALNEKVVKKQPTFIPKIMYPPSMVKGNLYPNIPQEISPRGEIATPQIPNEPLISSEPPSQLMTNRTSAAEQPALVTRGRLSSATSLVNDPTQQCPICTLDFPANFTDVAKTEHVNTHFD